jgi:agmatine deiminase
MNADDVFSSQRSIRIPAEWEPHACCWMAWTVQRQEWKDWTGPVMTELAGVIEAVAQFEPVRLLTPPDQLADARARFAGGNVEIIEAPVDDIWMRDIAPTFALRGEEVVAIDWNFNGWGNTRQRPARSGDHLAATADAVFGAPRVSLPFIAEGGALITDGQGTLVTTESCLLNPNRNPFGSEEARKQRIERALQALGVRRTIWLKGDPREPVTSGHIDGYAMFTAPGALLVEMIEDDDADAPQWREHDIATLERSNDAAGCRLRIERVRAPRKLHWKFKGAMFAPCYLNAYVADGAVIAGKFGDPERDKLAQEALERAFPGRRIVMLRIDHIASGGGGVRCLTQQMVKVGRIFK